uniref:Uncharacterized protein n=1 Tax=Psathyrostachys huashanica TaxID=37730 RepID=B9VSI5_9POAL|nr:unknown [Psathyrostachys huashanica]
MGVVASVAIEMKSCNTRWVDHRCLVNGAFNVTMINKVMCTIMCNPNLY